MSTKVNGINLDAAVATREETARSTSEPIPSTAVDVPRRRGAAYFDTVLWRLRDRMQESSEGSYLVGVTGCVRRSGTSTVAANLAIRAADHGMSPTLLVDANFRHPRQRRLLRSPNGPGLVEVLTGRVTTAEAIVSTKVAGLSLLPLGSRELIERSSMDQDQLTALLKELRLEYRLVVFDLADAEDLHHGLLFARHLDAALVVIRSESVRRRTAEVTVNRLIGDGVNVVGTVVTGQKQYTPPWLRRWL